MKKSILLLAFVIGLTVKLSAQTTSLYVQHPQLTSKYGQGTIENAVVAMTPNGTFMKYDVTMTFSARSVPSILPLDSVEVTFQFGLPSEAVVYDLWLWVGKDLSRGLILDRSIASATYENIVKRRRDPAFLQKMSQALYQLQIYPMAGAGTRTVKFSYSVPMKRTGKQWYAEVPAYLFRKSMMPLQSLSVIYYAPTKTHLPSVINDSRFGFSSWTDSLTRVAAWKCDIPNAVFTATIPYIAVPVSEANNFIIAQCGNTSGSTSSGSSVSISGGTYHVMLDPFALLGVNTSRKILVAFDYDSVKTTLTRSAYIEAVKAMLKANCSAKDSFNVVFNDWQRSGENWFPADSSGIANAFITLGAGTIPNGSNIPGLFMNAVEFLNAHGGEGNILLVAASDKLGMPAVADPVIEWLRVKLPAGVGVHIVDASNRNGNYYYSNGTYFYGNKYFYDAVKNLTSGSTRIVPYGDDLLMTVAYALQALRGGLGSLDIQMRYANGFTYSKFSYGIVPFQSVLTSQLVGQIGKYVGSGPVTLELAGFYRGQPYQKTIAVSDSLLLPADSSLRAAWVGKYISDIEWLSTNSADAIKTMVDECSKERVVCRYTALLALEPGDTLLLTANEKRVIVTHAGSTSGAPSSYTVADAYPNPFNPSTTLRVRLPEGVSAKDARLKIYNILGQCVKTFDPEGLTTTSYKEIRWDAVDDSGCQVASGMYVFVVTTPGARYSVKLMFLK